MKDHTKYAFKGEKPESKRRFARTAIAKLVKHYNFNTALVSGMLNEGALVEVNSITEAKKCRYHLSPEDLIISSDLKLWAVTGEWGLNIEKLVAIVEGFGYRVMRS